MAADDRQAPGRGVLEGAFHLLDVLSRFEGGAGLSELCRAAQLPKTTTYRMLEQLLELGVVDRQGGRYLVGPLLGRLGMSWQPDPALAAAARTTIRTLSARTTSVVALTVIHNGRPVVAVGTRGVLTEVPAPRPADLIGETTAAAGVHRLVANPPDRDPPPGYTRAAWRAAHRRYERAGTVLIEHEEVVPSISCAAAPVLDVDGTPVAALSAMTIRSSLPTVAADLTARAAREITRNLERIRRG